MSDPIVGQTISVGATVKDIAGALADVGTGPTCAVTQPDGTSATASVVHNSIGSYTASLANAPQAGRYLFVWSASGANSAGFPYSDYVNVWPTDPKFLVPLAQARDSLNFTASNTVHDDEIRLYLAAVTPVIEDIAGPVLADVRTVTADGGDDAILLYETPGFTEPSTVTVTENGTVLVEGTDFVVNYQAGIVYRQYAGGASRVWGNALGQYAQRGVVVIEYGVGGTVTAPNVVLAALEEFRFLYSIGQQGQRPSFGQDNSDMAFTPSGFAVPRRVVELLQPQMSDRYLGVY